MFDLTDDVENSPTNYPEKAKPAEVKTLKEMLDEETIKDKKPEKAKFEEPSWKDKKSDDYNEYEYSNNPDEDDTKW